MSTVFSVALTGAALTVAVLGPAPAHASEDVQLTKQTNSAPPESRGQPGLPAALNAMLADVVEVNPAVEAMEARIAALRQAVDRSDAWNDPMIAVEYSNIPIDSLQLGDHPMSGLQLKLQETFVFPGKTARRVAVAQGHVREATWQLDEKRNQLRGLVKRAYWNLALSRQLRAVTQEHVKLVVQFIDAVRVKYEVGATGQHELLRLEVLRDQLKDDLDDFDRRERRLMATMNAALRRRAEEPIATPERTPALGPPASQEELLQGAATDRPALRRLGERSATARLEADRVRHEAWPDVTAWVGYRVRAETSPTDPGTDQIAVGVSVPLPLFHEERWGTRASESLALADSADAEREALLYDIEEGVDSALADWRRAFRKARAYRDSLMVTAHRALDSTFAAYQVGRAEFASLYQSELQLLSFEKAARTAEAETLLARAAIETLIGADLGVAATEGGAQ